MSVWIELEYGPVTLTSNMVECAECKDNCEEHKKGTRNLISLNRMVCAQCLILMILGICGHPVF